MKTFAVKEKRSAPAIRRSQPSRFGYRGPEVKAQQAEIHRILRSTGARAKLTIGQPNDKYEQEADRIAEQVMRMPEQKVQRQIEEDEEEKILQTKPLADQITPLVQRQEEPPEEEEEVQGKLLQKEADEEEEIQKQPEEEEETAQAKLADGIQIQRQEEPQEEEEEPLQAKQENNQPPKTNPGLSALIHSLNGGGRPLPGSVRNYFEPRFSADLSQVQVHADSKAAGAAKSINAKAFTAGKDIVFGSGQYSPNTSTGKQLLAHELTHMMQQDIVKGGQEHAPSIMLKKLPTYRETLEREKISELKPDTIIKLKGLLTNPAKRQDAIDTILVESGLKGRLLGVIGETMLYEPRLEEKCKSRKKASEEKGCDTIRGQTIKDLRKPLRRDIHVEIGPKAFESVSILYSTLYHEYVHVKQRTSFEGGPGKLASEVEAYFFELKRAAITGIAADIKELIGNFGNLRDVYLALKNPEKTKYKKDYDGALHETLRLLLKKIREEKDPSELSLNLAIAGDFRDKVGHELSAKDNATLTTLSQSKYKKYFIAETERIYSLGKPVESSLDWYNLKTSYEKLSESDKKTMHGQYVKAFKVMFKQLVRSIMIWKPKASSITGVDTFLILELLQRMNALERLYVDLPDELKSKLKPQYERALKHLKKVEKGFK